MGACEALGRNIITDAFGIVAMVAMTPLITIQIMGLIFRIKESKLHNEMAATAPVSSLDTYDDMVKKELEKKLKIDAPGGGISFITPLSSIGGKKALQFLIEKQDYQKSEETTLKDTTHELIIVIAEQGYTGMIMDAARAAGADTKAKA